MTRKSSTAETNLAAIMVNCGWAFLALLLFISTVMALPRLSVETGLKCGTCHIDPNGGGARNEFGNHVVAFNELCLPQTKKLVKDHYISPRVAKNLLIGFDSRYLVFDDGYIFRMQTDVYLNVTPFKNFSYQFRFWENGISENYALLYLGEQKYYAKLGRFYPAYGLRNADHKAFNRERTGHPSNLYLDGLSLGYNAGRLKLVGEVFSEGRQNIFGLNATYTAYNFGLNYMAGVSWRSSEEIENTDSNGRFPFARAVFGGLSYDRFTLMGELDLVGRASDTLIAYANLTSRLTYGLYLIGEYNFFDGNRNAASGVDEFVRLSVELFPLPYVELRPSYTYYTSGVRKNEDDFFVQFHVGY